MTQRHEGGCVCGKVRFVANGEPNRVGLCHCQTCRKAHAAPFSFFAIYPAVQVELSGGPLAMFESSPKGRRYFCPACGSRIYEQDVGSSEIELYPGSFDEPDRLGPRYECFSTRREGWLPALPADVKRYERNRLEADPKTP